MSIIMVFILRIAGGVVAIYCLGLFIVLVVAFIYEGIQSARGKVTRDDLQKGAEQHKEMQAAHKKKKKEGRRWFRLSGGDPFDETMNAAMGKNRFGL